MVDFVVKRYKVGFKGNNDYNELIPAKNKTEARKSYARKRGFLKSVPSNIIVKKWNGRIR